MPADELSFDEGQLGPGVTSVEYLLSEFQLIILQSLLKEGTVAGPA
jgi:hypothetical protein